MKSILLTPNQFLADGVTPDPDYPNHFVGVIPEKFAPKAVVITIGAVKGVVFDDGEGNLIAGVDTEQANIVNYVNRRFDFYLDPTLGFDPNDDVVTLFYTPVAEAQVVTDYTVLSFDGWTALLNRLVSLKDSWKDLYLSNQGQVIIDLMSYIGAAQSYMIMRRSQESYIKTARLRSSLIRLADLLDYRVRRKVSSVTTLRFEVASPHGVDIIIPRRTRVISTSGIPFLTVDDAVLQAGEDFVDVDATQGEVVVTDYVLPVLVPPSQVIQIGDTSIEDSDSSLVVRIGYQSQVDTSFLEWGRVDSFIESVNSSKHYQVVYGLNNDISIRFGDGVFGAIPPGSVLNGDASLVRVTHIRTLGARGNVSSLNSITRLTSTFTDSGLLTVKNITIASGGDDEQSTEEIRVQAPAVFRTGDRGVTREDLITILLDQPGVVLANVWGENENNPPNYDYFNKIEIAVVMNSPLAQLDWANPSQTQRETIDAVLQRKKVLTTKIFYVPAVEISVQMEAAVTVRDSFSLVDTRQRVLDALNAYFEIGQRGLGESVFLSNICEVIESIDGVHHVDLEFLEPISSVDEDDILEAQVSPGNVYNFNLERTPVIPATVFLSYGDRFVVDDGLGVLTGDATGTVNYATGAVSLTIPPLPTFDPIQLDAFYKAVAFQVVPSPGELVASPWPISQQSFNGNLAQIPVRPGTLSMTLKDVDDETLRASISDDGLGNLIGSGLQTSIVSQQVGVGDGVTTIFATVLNPKFITPGQFEVKFVLGGVTYTATDGICGAGIISMPGFVSGTINYITGALSLTFDNPPDLDTLPNPSKITARFRVDNKIDYDTGYFTFSLSTTLFPTGLTEAANLLAIYNSYLSKECGGNLILARDEFTTFNPSFYLNNITFGYLPRNTLLIPPN